jgi:hypothetical protein
METEELITTAATARELGITPAGLKYFIGQHPELQPEHAPMWTALEALTARQALEVDRLERSAPYRLARRVRECAAAVMSGHSSASRTPLIASAQLCELLQINKTALWQFSCQRAKERFGVRLRALRIQGKRGTFFRVPDVLVWLNRIRALYSRDAVEAPVENESPAIAESPKPTFTPEEFAKILK